jgi:cell division septal protein FtsQ
VVTDPRLQDALHLLDLCDADPVYSRILRIRQIDVRDERHLLLTLDGDSQVELTRKDMMEQLKRLAVFTQHAETRGVRWTNSNFTVNNNPSFR